MTSRLRKKHPITQPSIPQANPVDSYGEIDWWVPDNRPVSTAEDTSDLSLLLARSSFSQSSTWLPAALLATLTLLAGALQAFGGDTQLQWRRATTPSSSARSQTARPVRHVVTKQRDARGYAVVQVAYNESDDWASTSAAPASGAVRLESVVVHPQSSGAGSQPNYRTAQEPTTQDPFENDTIDDELSRDITEPFGVPQIPDQLPDDLGGIDELPEPIEPSIPVEPDDEEDLFDQPEIEPEPGDDPTLQPGVTPDVEPQRPDPFGPTQPERDLFDRGERTAPTLSPDLQAQQESCEQELRDLTSSRISNIELAIDITGEQGRDYPYECAFDDGSVYTGRSWPEVTFNWKAAATCHKPLYFEQPHLERYGHSWGPCIQPIISGAHFFTRLPVLPYCMGITPPNECIYPLGYYRPGNCAPYMIDAVPFTWRAAAFQAGATVGTAAILP